MVPGPETNTTQMLIYTAAGVGVEARHLKKEEKKIPLCLSFPFIKMQRLCSICIVPTVGYGDLFRWDRVGLKDCGEKILVM